MNPIRVSPPSPILQSLLEGLPIILLTLAAGCHPSPAMAVDHIFRSMDALSISGEENP